MIIVKTRQPISCSSMQFIDRTRPNQSEEMLIGQVEACKNIQKNCIDFNNLVNVKLTHHNRILSTYKAGLMSASAARR